MNYVQIYLCNCCMCCGRVVSLEDKVICKVSDSIIGGHGQCLLSKMTFLLKACTSELKVHCDAISVFISCIIFKDYEVTYIETPDKQSI